MERYKLIILDRDGVINQESDAYIKSPDEWLPIPGSLAAIAQLNRHKYQVAIATNQSGVARGYYTHDTLAAIHAKMNDALTAEGAHIDLIRFCPHGPNDGCHCRKPKPGLLKEIMQHCDVSPSETLVIGDSLRDIQAAHAAHCHAALVKTGHGEATLADATLPKNIPVFLNLAEAANALCKNANAFR
jgi:D-glycero-D-manno-heptose 1,7-bisphosphate phosphatase